MRLRNHALGRKRTRRRAPAGWEEGPQTSQVIYFIGRVRHDGVREIQVGKTDDFLRRFEREHQKEAERNRLPKWDVLALVHGARPEEDVIKAAFAEWLISAGNAGTTEIFDGAKPILEYIHWLRDWWFVSLTPAPTVCSLTDLTCWTPSAESQWRLHRVKPLINKSGTQVGLFEQPRSEWECFGVPDLKGADDYYTPQCIVDRARHAMMGRIDLDPASTPMANRTIGATRIYQRFDNGLEQPWAGRVWLNPPFTGCAQWATKALAEWRRGEIVALCMLVSAPALTAQYIEPLHSAARALAIIRGRPAHTGFGADASPAGYAIFYFGNDPRRFRDAFKAGGDGRGSVWFMEESEGDERAGVVND